MATLPEADSRGDSPWLGRPEARAAVAWPLPSRAALYVTLDSRRDTVLYWSGVALVVLGLYVTRLLPCVDYPQHLALSDVARRLADPAAPEAAKYQLNYFTYNGLSPHPQVAWLSRVVPIELAGRLVVSATLVAMAGAVVALLRTLRRPVVHAALFTPILFSFSVGWGFVNYALATAIATWTLVVIARAAVRPSILSALGVAVLGMAVRGRARARDARPLRRGRHARARGRVARGLAGGLVASATRARARARGRPPHPPRLRVLPRRVPRAAPLGPPTCTGIPRSRASRRRSGQKLLWVHGAYSTDLFWDATDQIVPSSCRSRSWGWSEWLSWKRRRGLAVAGRDAAPEDPPAIVLPFVVLLAAYFATPMVLIGTHLIFPRLAQWAVLGAVLATPRFPAEQAARARKWMLRLGVFAGANLTLHCASYAWETNDASRVIDDLPEGGAATAVIWDAGTYSFRNGTLVHLAAYYGARKHGAWAFAFARYLESVPVRFKANSQPAWPAQGWEFDGEAYDARCKYARAFPLVIVRAPEDLPVTDAAEGAVRRLVFKAEAPAPRLLSHHGRFWAFDSTGIPDDGTL